MTDYPSTSNLQSPSGAGRLLRYLALGVAANALIWSFAMVFLKQSKPVYTSSWTLSIPDGIRSTTVNLPGLGSATEQQRNPFANDVSDPREVYKAIIGSKPVVDAAEKRLGYDVGKPRVEIVDNTTLMSLSITGDSPDEAQSKATAINEAFQARLNELRLQETVRQEQGLQTVLTNARKKLEDAQRRLSDFKARSGYVSDTQVTQLSNSIEDLRRKRAESVAQQQQAAARLNQLSANLQLSPPQAGEAFVLKADPLFQKYLQNYSESNATLIVLNSKFGPNHPLVIRERSRQDAARTALLSRSQSLLNRPVDQGTLARLNIGESNNVSALENLFQNLVIGQIDERGLVAQSQELERQIAGLEGRLSALAKQGATVDILTRDMQIAQTVFASTLARLDVSKLDAFGSYPAVQVLEDPSLPNSSSSPNRKIVLLGAGLASLFVISALISFWTRKSWLPRLAGRRSNRTEPVAISDAPLLSPTSNSEVH
jgi:uncharacterized protein involved in exopolysaccharide biosynthesis